MWNGNDSDSFSENFKLMNNELVIPIYQWKKRYFVDIRTSVSDG